MVTSHNDMHERQNRYQSGAEVPESGIYRVMHAAHRLPHEVVALKGDRFPRCAKCQDEVFFELVHAVPGVNSEYKVYELPVLDDDTAESA